MQYLAPLLWVERLLRDVLLRQVLYPLLPFPAQSLDLPLCLPFQVFLPCDFGQQFQVLNGQYMRDERRQCVRLAQYEDDEQVRFAYQSFQQV